MCVTHVSAIDVHAHYGAYDADTYELANEFMTGDAAVVVERATLARTRLTVVSPLLALFSRSACDIVSANEETARITANDDALRHWVVVNPLEPRTYEQADAMLRLPRCVGIKIHPQLHGYPISEHGSEVFRFAADHAAVVLTHSGEPNSLPADFVPFTNAFPDARLILAHLGCGWDGDPSHQVRAVQSSRHRNVFIDTSSAKNVMPRLMEWAVAEVGADRLLYGTDSPLYFAPMQRARIDYANISDREKQLILHDNAAALLALEDRNER